MENADSASRCRVLFLIPSLAGGGAERAVVTLLQHMDRGRFELTLGVLDMNRAVYRDLVPRDVHIVDMSSARVRHAVRGIVRLTWSSRPEVIVSTLSHLNLLLAVVKPLLPPASRLVARESTLVSANLATHRFPALWRLSYRIFYRQLDCVISQSNAAREDLLKRYSLPAHKIAVIQNAVDISHIRPLLSQEVPASFPDGTKVELVAAGRLAAEKGFDLLIEAMALCADLPVRLTILGEGPLDSELRQLVRARGLTGRVQFVGFQKNPFAWFARANIFVLSSRFEGFPNVVLEALACGTPVIATPAPGGTREILEPIPQCEVVSSISAESIAGAIRRWSGRTISRVPSEVVEHYSVERVVRRYEEEILQVASRRASVPGCRRGWWSIGAWSRK